MRAVTFVMLGLLLAGTALLGAGRARTVAQEATPASGAACPTTTLDENKALVRRWYEDVWDKRDLNAIGEILADDYVRYRAGIPFANKPGTADDVQFVKMVMAEFPNVAFSIEDMLAEGDEVAVRTITTGTQMGPMTDMGDAPATGRSMERENIAIWRVACGKLAEQWIVQDNLGMLLQLGVITEEEMADVGTPTVATPMP
jgi:predicted ester cyclase